MRSIKITKLLFLVAIMVILTACPPTDSGNADNGGGSKGDSVTGPKFQNLSIDVAKKKIIVFFNTKISGTPDASKISVRKGTATLKSTADYTLAIKQGRLVITLKVDPKENDKYTVKLQGGAVKNAKGKDSTANTSSDKKTLTVGSIPAITEGSLAFQANSNTVLTLAFNTDIEIFDKAKIKVEVQAGGTGKFTAARASSVVDTTTTTQLNLTLGTAATHGNVYKVTVGAGAIRATESNLVNAGALSSSQTTYSTSLILSPPPYILDNKLVAPFNLSIAINDWTKVKVYKDPETGSDGDAVPLVSGNVAVNNKKLLEITLPEDVVEAEVYRLRLDAGAVSEEGKAANANKAITPADIIIWAAPALHTETAPALFGKKIIVTFDAPIRILDKTRIKYQLNSTLTTPSTDPAVVNTNRLEIPLNAIPTAGQVYRIDLANGAIAGKNTVSIGTIKPEDKDITVVEPTLTNVQPAFESTIQLSVTFPVDVAIVGDGSKINVQKKDDKDDEKTGIDESSFRTVSSRDIAVDDTETKKINIILTGSEKITPYTQVWKVEFPPNTVKTATSQIPNSGPLTTAGGVLRLTDLYSWTLVTQESGSSKWKARSLHTSVVFKGKIWVLGGHDGDAREILNDVWSSKDGETWTESKPPNDRDGNKVSKDTEGTAANWWLARADHTSVVFKDKIWVLGGYTGKYMNDVWSSEDGETWTESKPSENADKDTAGAAANWWPARDRHTSVVFKGKIWVLGGFDGTDPLSDVWSSLDGSVWKKENASADWEARHKHASAVFDNKIWVIGGQGSEDIQNSVWYSTNGQAWTRSDTNLTDNPHDNFRNHRIVKYNKRLWIFGGGQNIFLSSVSPTAGWTEETALSLRIRKTQAVVFKKRIWLLGGDYGGNPTSNVWKIGPASE